MVKIVTDFIPKGRKNRPGTSLTPAYITIHSTANKDPGTDALAHAKFLKSPWAEARMVSWHYTVDDIRIVKHLPTSEVGWHAGDGSRGLGNSRSIGIELCQNKGGDIGKVIYNGAELTAILLKAYHIPITALRQHYDWTRKDCPTLLRHEIAEGWGLFTALVAMLMSVRK